MNMICSSLAALVISTVYYPLFAFVFYSAVFRASRSVRLGPTELMASAATCLYISKVGGRQLSA